MANKIVKIPVSEVDGLRSDGSYKLRYRVTSKDGSQKSDWSEIQSVPFPLNKNGQVSSFYELYLGTGRPFLEDVTGVDPHTLNKPYDVATVVTAAIGVDVWTKSYITASPEVSETYIYNWTIPTTPTIQLFDVYISWKDNLGSWKDWQYIATTSSSSVSFTKPNLNYQAVQAAVFLSSSPKLTNIYKEETTLVSISEQYSTFYSATATIGTVSGTNPYTATVTGLTGVPVANLVEGRRVYGVDGVAPQTGKLGSGVVTIGKRVSSSSVTISSGSTITAGQVTDFRI